MLVTDVTGVGLGWEGHNRSFLWDVINKPLLKSNRGGLVTQLLNFGHGLLIAHDGFTWTQLRTQLHAGLVNPSLY